MRGRVAGRFYRSRAIVALLALIAFGANGCMSYMGDLEIIDKISHPTNNETKRRDDIVACKKKVDYPKEGPMAGGQLMGVTLLGGVGVGGLASGMLNSAYVDIQHRLILCLRQRGYLVEVTKRGHG